MKKYFFSLLFAFGIYFLNAQTINDIPIKDIDVEYIQIIGTSLPFTSKQDIVIDFGRRSKYFKPKTNIIIKDENGKTIDLDSMIDALNFLSNFGFELVSSHGLFNQNLNDRVNYFILRKKK